MPSTFTANAAQAGVQPKGGHIGVQTDVFTVGGFTTGISQGDVVLACKIPNFATVLDCAIKVAHKADAGPVTLTVFVAKANDGAASAIATFGTVTGLSATSGSVMFRPANPFGGPFRLSLSDDAAVQYALLKFAVSGTATTTTSFSCNGYVTFCMDESGV